MELSFGIRTWLSLLLTVIGFVSAVFSALYNPWPILLAIAMFILALILLVYDAHIHGRERTDFRNKIIHELWIMGGMLVDIPIGNSDLILYNAWSSKDASFEKNALGDDYELWKKFYDSIDARNDFFAPLDAFRIEDSVKLRQSCMQNFSQLLSTPMVQQSALKEKFDGLVVKAKYRKLL
jgi:hypothetical protein